MFIYTKETLIERLREIKKMGWIESKRKGNTGAVGNTLEDLLGIPENNLPIANASEWELKTRRKNTTSLTTLFHCEPSPRTVRFVPNVLLPQYGWSHTGAGDRYNVEEMSFRQTINALTRTDRGFKIIVDKIEQKITVSFDANSVGLHHSNWLSTVDRRVGLGELNPQPYWGFEDIYHKAATKLVNMFYIVADHKIIDNVEFFSYQTIMKLTECDKEKLLIAIEQGALLVDFDARTGHNHGTKFRLRQDKLPELYRDVELIV